MSKSPRALYDIAKVKATRYMDSHPGLDNAGCNTNCHPGFHKLIEGTPIDFDELYRLNEILDYRQGQVELADTYCDFLKIGVPEGRHVDQFDEWEWQGSQLEEKNARDFIPLGAGLAESPMSTQQIHEKLEDLLQYKLENARCAARSPLGEAVLDQPEI